MLANNHISAAAGRFEDGVHLPRESISVILEFIAQELPRWRGDFHRDDGEVAENRLTSQLCRWLSAEAVKNPGIDIFQFHHQPPDEMYRRATIDLAPYPMASFVYIGARRYSRYEMLFPIECKRLPTPRASKRDAREYVCCKYTSNGGIERFKRGVHGSGHEFAAMIGYVQGKTNSYWLTMINKWLDGLCGQEGWSSDEKLLLMKQDKGLGLMMARSTHLRSGANEIVLRHLWIELPGK